MRILPVTDFILFHARPDCFTACIMAQTTLKSGLQAWFPTLFRSLFVGSVTTSDEHQFQGYLSAQPSFSSQQDQCGAKGGVRGPYDIGPLEVSSPKIYNVERDVFVAWDNNPYPMPVPSEALEIFDRDIKWRLEKDLEGIKKAIVSNYVIAPWRHGTAARPSTRASLG